MISISTIPLRQRPQSLSQTCTILTTCMLVFHFDSHFRRGTYARGIFGWRESEVGKSIIFNCRIIMSHCPTERRPRDIVEFRPSSYTGSRASLNLSMRWVKDCARNHKLCNLPRSSQKRRLPTRLINTGLSATSLVRLCGTSDLPTETKYATLSHCWGTLNIDTLTTENLDALMKEIDTSKLSKTFQDAISLTQKCGVGYLWIDCLCIIQDSEDDWLHESRRMAGIYSDVKICLLLSYNPNIRL